MSQVEVLRARQDALEAAGESLREWVRAVDADAHTALDIARQNVKLMTALRATQLEHGQAIAGLVTEVADVKAEVTELRAELKGDVAELRAELKGDVAELRAELKGDVAELKGDVAELRAELKGDVAELRMELKDGLAEVLRRLAPQGTV